MENHSWPMIDVDSKQHSNPIPIPIILSVFFLILPRSSRTVD
jgi:hypothetical protein